VLVDSAARIGITAAVASSFPEATSETVETRAACASANLAMPAAAIAGITT
jgi:hypothetical protein